MKILKEKLKNSYISILDYFNEAFKLFWYFIKKEKRWIFLIFSILLISAMLENRLQTDVELDLKENTKYIFYNHFLTYPLYATYWVLYRKIIFKLTDKKENYNILKSYIRAFITVIIISIPILIITICNFYMNFFQYNYSYLLFLLSSQILLITLIFTAIMVCVFIYFLQVHMSKDLSLRKTLKYTLKVSKSNRWRYIICFLIENIAFVIIKEIIKIVVAFFIIWLHIDIKNIGMLVFKAFIENFVPALSAIYFISLISIIFVNVDYQKQKESIK